MHCVPLRNPITSAATVSVARRAAFASVDRDLHSDLEMIVFQVWLHCYLERTLEKLECGPMPNAMTALSNIGGALCSTPQRLANAHYWSAVQ